MTAFRAPLNRLRFKDSVLPAGMDPYVLLGNVPLLRRTAHDDAPVLVGPSCPTCKTRTVLDGRHRWIAAVIAGRHYVLAEEERR